MDGDRGIWIEGENIGGGLPGEWEGEKIDVLFEALSEHRKRERQGERGVAQESEKRDGKRKINILLDQGLPYEVLHKVMHTSALAGFSEFKFIVQGHH